VELSGVAEPSRMVPWGQSAGFMLDGVVVVVAADQLAPGALPEWIQQQLCTQITEADLLVLTKLDLVTGNEQTNAHLRLAALAPNTPVFSSRSDLRGTGATGRFLALGGRRPATQDIPPATLFEAHQVQLIAPPQNVKLSDLEIWLNELAGHVDGQIVRTKGIVSTTDAGLVLVQIVGARREITSLPEPERQPPTDLVVITIAADSPTSSSPARSVREVDNS
jgi:G3E family GTPase